MMSPIYVWQRRMYYTTMSNTSNTTEVKDVFIGYTKGPSFDSRVTSLIWIASILVASGFLICILFFACQQRANELSTYEEMKSLEMKNELTRDDL